jgi:nitric oxide reductase large subunit
MQSEGIRVVKGRRTSKGLQIAQGSREDLLIWSMVRVVVEATTQCSPTENKPHTETTQTKQPRRLFIWSMLSVVVFISIIVF